MIYIAMIYFIDLWAAVEEMKLIRAGKKKARNAEDFLNDL